MLPLSARLAEPLATFLRAQLGDVIAATGGDIAHLVLADGDDDEDSETDPAFSAYGVGLSLIFLVADAVAGEPDAAGFVRTLTRAERSHAPDGPPYSPVTASFFNSWSFLDLRIGSGDDTIGQCAWRAAEKAGLPNGFITVIANLAQSRPGFFLHQGKTGERIVLKDIATGEARPVVSVSGYHGHAGEVWYVRLVPPPHSALDYDVTLTTPYVVADADEAAVTAYFDRALKRSARTKRPIATIEDLLKRGPRDTYWLDYVHRRFSRFHDETAIILDGLPDHRP